MAYLESEKVVHRDLAARNVLISKGGSLISAKIADFGLSRATAESEYYKKEKSQIPVKWSALESIQFGRFSSKSDVSI
jgi:serine/threonine protein kinase